MKALKGSAPGLEELVEDAVAVALFALEAGDLALELVWPAKPFFSMCALKGSAPAGKF